MSSLKSKELIQAESLSDEGKLDEALMLINNFEQKEGLNHHDKASCHLLQCQILFWQGKYKKLIKHAEYMHKESRGRENNLFTVDNLLIMTHALVGLDRFDEASDLITQGEELIKTIPQELTKAYKQREAYLALIKGDFYSRRRNQKDADLALKHFEHSIALREELGIKHEIAESLSSLAYTLCVFKGELNRALKYIERGLALAKESSKKYYIAGSLHIMAMVYNLRGELDLSIRFYEQAIAFYKELNNKDRLCFVFNNLSYIYQMRGELDRALECQEQSIALAKELGNLRILAFSHDLFIQILIDKGDLERAQISLHDLEQLSSQLKDKQVNLMYLLNKALVLKSSSRAINRGKAEEILKQLLESEYFSYDDRIRVLLNLCGLLLTELRMINDLEVLDELKQFISQLLEIAEKSHSYWILCETYLIQAKLALISLDLKEAQKFLTQGQHIAEKYGLDRLAIKISNEHDELLKQLDVWKKLKETKAPVSERMKLARLNDQVERMVRKREIHVPELADEDPIVLLIISEGGRPLFSEAFVKEWAFDDHLFGGFLSALNSFSGEMFSEGLNRANFGEYTIIMNSLPPFQVCYLFKGQSYLALQRVKEFIDNIKEDAEIWKTFNEYNQTCRLVQLKDIPSLEPLITKIFIDKIVPLIT